MNTEEEEDLLKICTQDWSLNSDILHALRPISPED